MDHFQQNNEQVHRHLKQTVAAVAPRLSRQLKDRTIISMINLSYLVANCFGLLPQRLFGFTLVPFDLKSPEERSSPRNRKKDNMGKFDAARVLSVGSFSSHPRLHVRI